MYRAVSVHDTAASLGVSHMLIVVVSRSYSLEDCCLLHSIRRLYGNFWYHVKLVLRGASFS